MLPMQQERQQMSDKISFIFNRGDKVDSVVALDPESDSPLHQADSNHPNWDRIVELLKANDKAVFDLFDPMGAAAAKLMVLSERFTYDHGLIRFDGEVRSGPLADHLVRVIKTGTDDYGPIVKFWELVETNPSADSRDALHRWLAKHEFAIDDEGYIIGYKSVTSDPDNKDGYRSTHAGHAFVDGVEVNGYVSYAVGSVVTMPRNEVDDNHNKGCSAGLHVGDWSYAENFTGKYVVKVRVNPRDVVSIPNDDSRKMRCCRLEVVKVVTAPEQGPIVFSMDKAKEKALAAQPTGYVPFG